MTQRTLSHGGYGSPTEPGQGLEAINVRSLFGYMFPQLASDPSKRLPEDHPDSVRKTDSVRKSLKALGQLMASQGADKGDSQTVPAGYTYWGQFIDHDITANDLSPLKGNDVIDDFTPMTPDAVISKVVNMRRPALDLDSVFGDGPRGEAAHFYEADGIRLKIGDNDQNAPGDTPPPNDSVTGMPDLKRDLLRNANRAPLIGDTRNDENLVVAQLHVGFMRFYNAVVSWLSTNRGLAGDMLLGESVRVTRWQYQWLVVHDYLKTVAQENVVTDILEKGAKFYRPSINDPFEPFMPLEFSAAAFRFGHSMVRAVYDFNRNFGDNPPPSGNPGNVLPNAPFELLFQFTGTGRFDGRFDGVTQRQRLPHNWIIEWDRFFNKQDPDTRHRARRFDTGLALPLATMINETVPNPGQPSLAGEQKAIMEHLAMRNLLRGYLFSLPTGQAVAKAMGETELDAADLKAKIDPHMTQEEQELAIRTNDLLESEDFLFLKKTPLWYYILKEAEVKAGGNTLGPMGSRIVAETIIGLIRADRNSYLNSAQPWEPSLGVLLPPDQTHQEPRPIRTIMDMLRFAGVAV